MSDEYQLRKDIDRTLSNIYNLRNGELIVVRFGDESKYRDKDGNYLSIDTILNDFYDKPMIYTKEEVDNAVNTAISQITDKAYPIGSIYMSVNDVNPSELFGGEWEQIQGRFLLASGDLTDENDNVIASYDNESIGGEATHTLTIDEIPSHYHSRTTQPQSWGERDSSASQIISPESGSAKSVTKNTSNTGGGQAHNNMPPYLVVNVWKRIA